MVHAYGVGCHLYIFFARFSQDLKSEIEDFSLTLLLMYMLIRCRWEGTARRRLLEGGRTMNNLLTQKFPITALLMLLMISMSCSHEPIIEPENPGGTDVHEWEDSTINGDAIMTEMAFSVSDGSMVVERQGTTRSTTAIDGSGAFSTGDLVAVAVTRNATETIKLYRVKSDGGLEYAGSDEPFVWKSATETVSVRAWSYGTSTQDAYTLVKPEDYDYSLETDQQTNDYHELLYCKAANKSYSSSPLTLTFYHQLTRLVINVSHEQTGALSVTSACIGTVPITARFSVPTGSSNVGTWNIGSTNGTITPNEEATPVNGYQKTYSVIIFPATYTKDSQLFTLTNSEGNFVYSITESSGQTLAAGNQYQYSITVKDGIFRRNPLWYVAPYNMLNATTMATTDNAGYYYPWSQAMSEFGAQASSYNDYRRAGKIITGYSGTWHLPILDELRSLFPGYQIWGGSKSDIFDLDNGTGTYKASNLVVKFGYNAITRAGIDEASYWKKISSTEIHAIRYLGTDYCSAWKYIIDSYKLTVYSTLIEKVENSQSAAATFYSTKFNTTTFGDNGTTAACRVFWKYGFYDPSTPQLYPGNAQYWSATQVDGENSAWLIQLGQNMFNTQAGAFVYRRPVRLFRDY